METMLAGANLTGEGVIPTMIGIVALLFAAIGLVVQLKDAFNTVWEVDTSRETGLWPFLRT